MATSLKITVFWDVEPCSMVEIDRRFRDAYCIYHLHWPDDGAVIASETSATFGTTLYNFLEDSHH
jgi:hypothetical protein